jgi:hypothetical protein
VSFPLPYCDSLLIHSMLLADSCYYV